MKLRRLSVTLTLVAAFASDSWGQSQRQPAQSKQTTQPPTPDQRGTDQIPFTVKILPAQDAEKQADKTEHNRKEKAIIDEKIAFETQRIADYTDRLAIFTILLFCVAVFQAGFFLWQLGYMSEEVKRNRQAFISVHRPRVIVRYIEGTFDDKGHQVAVVHVVNIGTGSAQIREFGGDLARRKGKEWLTLGASGKAKGINPIDLISGQRHEFTVVAKASRSEHDIFLDATDTESSIKTCVFGEVRYADENGVMRETGFFRTYDPKSEKFVPSQDQGEEYQD
jgi:hypothetical protein